MRVKELTREAIQSKSGFLELFHYEKYYRKLPLGKDVGKLEITGWEEILDLGVLKWLWFFSVCLIWIGKEGKDVTEGIQQGNGHWVPEQCYHYY